MTQVVDRSKTAPEIILSALRCGGPLTEFSIVVIFRHLRRRFAAARIAAELDALEARGLIERVPGDGEGRGYEGRSYRITAKGL